MLDLKPIMGAARQAADLCSEVQRKYLERTDKAGKEPVTIADYGSQAIICRTISQVFPDDGVLAEEQGKELMKLGLDIKERQLQLEKTYSDRLVEVISTKQMLSLRKAEDDFRKMIIQRLEDRKRQQMQRDQMINRREQLMKDKGNN